MFVVSVSDPIYVLDLQITLGEAGFAVEQTGERELRVLDGDSRRLWRSLMDWESRHPGVRAEREPCEQTFKRQLQGMLPRPA